MRTLITLSMMLLAGCATVQVKPEPIERVPASVLERFRPAPTPAPIVSTREVEHGK